MSRISTSLPLAALETPGAGPRMAAPDLPLHDISWPADQLSEGLGELARRTGLAGLPETTLGDVPAVPPAAPADFDRWMAAVGRRNGAEVEPAETTVAGLEAMIRTCAPAVLRCRTETGARYILLLAARGASVWVLTPGMKRRRIAVEALRAAVAAPLVGRLQPEVDRLMEVAGIAARRRGKVGAMITAERLGGERIAGCWLLRVPATAPLWRQARTIRIPSRIAAMLLLFAASYVLEILGWKIIGGAALDGRLDLGWLGGWALVLLTLVPIGLAASWFNRRLTLDIGALLKTRLLLGALNVDIDAARRTGAGRMLARVIESQAFETLAIGGGLGVLVAGLELAFAAWLLSIGAGSLLHLALLLLWTVGVLTLALHYHRRLRRWTSVRLSMTHDLVERMVGHRTTLAQECALRRDREADRATLEYVAASGALDRKAAGLLAAAAGSWMVAGVAGLAPAFVNGTASGAALAIGIGGVLMAGRAISALANALSSVSRAAIAWEEVAPLFRSAATGEEPGSAPVATLRTPDPAQDGGTLVEAEGVTFGYADRAGPILDNIALRIHAGDRVLVEGESGAGKSTLASLLVGLRTPASGLLLLNGLDRRTWGAAWHRMVAGAPQFHENHIFSGTLAFNLLMGRNWPPSEADLALARQICEELGLGELLGRMPGGLMQVIGETGWQLSHGERSRVFLARALLQEAPLTVIDESFAALDPETLALCLDCVFRRARTSVIVAHP